MFEAQGIGAVSSGGRRGQAIPQEGGTLHLWVKPLGCGACCPECGRRCKLVRRSVSQPGREMRTWRDAPVGGLSVALHYRPREILCPTHGRLQEEVSWAVAKARSTLRLECELLRLCKAMPQKEAREMRSHCVIDAEVSRIRA